LFGAEGGGSPAHKAGVGGTVREVRSGASTGEDARNQFRQIREGEREAAEA